MVNKELADVIKCKQRKEKKSGGLLFLSVNPFWGSGRENPRCPTVGLLCRKLGSLLSKPTSCWQQQQKEVRNTNKMKVGGKVPFIND